MNRRKQAGASAGGAGQPLVDVDPLECGAAGGDALLGAVMRRVMVASGRRNARAISAVVRPPTARRVSAICDADGSSG